MRQKILVHAKRSSRVLLELKRAQAERTKRMRVLDAYISMDKLSSSPGGMKSLNAMIRSGKGLVGEDFVPANPNNPNGNGEELRSFSTGLLRRMD